MSTPLPSKFTDIPAITDPTLASLRAASFTEPTQIQQLVLPFALQGKDVLAEAQTGSGKTLAFVIPILERLVEMNWNKMDGLGAIILAPTRELALQIFQVLRLVGNRHSTLSAGLVVGGKDYIAEKERIPRMNILVATPGRLLQHLDETPHWNCDNLQMLVLDEADRILDLGFKAAVNSILDHLPRERQTMLFSATQTKSVKDLARLSLTNPEYVSTKDYSACPTPTDLDQHYMMVNLEDKVDMLHSFIKLHLKSKTIVFLTTCKQVRFIYESFAKLQPGIPLLHLLGRQSHDARTAIYQNFKASNCAVLFCTDIVARGLDFPLVDWVLQLDCPEDVDTYIHRAGRASRHGAKGNALLTLLPSEAAFKDKLVKKGVPIKQRMWNKDLVKSVQKSIASICAEWTAIKYLAQMAFVSYMKSILKQKDKEVFDVSTLPTDAFAASLGLPGAPKIKIINKAKEAKNQSLALSKLKGQEKPEEEPVIEPKAPKKSKVERLMAKKNNSVLSEHYARLKEADPEEDTTEDLFHLARTDHSLSENFLEDTTTKKDSVRERRRAERAKKLKLDQVPVSTHFDDEGNAYVTPRLETLPDFIKKGGIEERRLKFLEEQAEKYKVSDVLDKDEEKDRRRKRRQAKKDREREVQIQQSLGAELDTGDEPADVDIETQSRKRKLK